jgi:hypothetical protein
MQGSEGGGRARGGGGRRLEPVPLLLATGAAGGGASRACAAGAAAAPCCLRLGGWYGATAAKPRGLGLGGEDVRVDAGFSGLGRGCSTSADATTPVRCCAAWAGPPESAAASSTALPPALPSALPPALPSASASGFGRRRLLLSSADSGCVLGPGRRVPANVTENKVPKAGRALEAGR